MASDLSEEADRLQQPSDIEAEQVVLGVLLIHNTPYRRIAELLAPEHFVWRRHQKIYRCIVDLIDAGMIADPQSVRHRFREEDCLKDVGGSAYLTALASSVVSTIGVPQSAMRIRDLYHRRKLIEWAGEMIRQSQDMTAPTILTIERIAASLSELAASMAVNRAKRFDVAWDQAMALAESAWPRAGRTTGLSTGFAALDEALDGLHRPELIVVSGLPSMGKTAFATNIARMVAKHYRETTAPEGGTSHEDGGRVLYVSLGLPGWEIAMRWASQESGIPLAAVRHGRLGEEGCAAFVEAGANLRALPLFLLEDPSPTVDTIRTHARNLQRNAGGLELIVIDDIQRLSPANDRSAADGGIRPAEIMNGLKSLATSLDVAVLAVAPLPAAEALREGHSYFEKADVVISVFRKAEALKHEEPVQRPGEPKGELDRRHEEWQRRLAEAGKDFEVSIEKQGHGPNGRMLFQFERETTKLSDTVPWLPSGAGG